MLGFPPFLLLGLVSCCSLSLLLLLLLLSLLLLFIVCLPFTRSYPTSCLLVLIGMASEAQSTAVATAPLISRKALFAHLDAFYRHWQVHLLCCCRHHQGIARTPQQVFDQPLHLYHFHYYNGNYRITASGQQRSMRCRWCADCTMTKRCTASRPLCNYGCLAWSSLRPYWFSPRTR
jgi:hypothetical protein